MRGMLKSFGALLIISAAGVGIVAAQAPPAAKPGPEHAKLGYFVGKWTGQGDVKTGSDGPRWKDDVVR